MTVANYMHVRYVIILFRFLILFSYFLISYLKTNFLAKNDPKKWIYKKGLEIMVVFISW